MKTLLLSLVLALAAAACNSSSSGSPEPKLPLTDLSNSLDAVRAEFNAHEHEPRFLTLVAPT
jgi:hypothetical protein